MCRCRSSSLPGYCNPGEFQKVGGSDTERSDVRYLCATNREPWGEVQAGRFREDLYYRLHVVPCAMPPLRERDDDLLLLARHFLAAYATEEGKTFSGFDDGAERALRRHSWPGNIRELQNVLRNAVLFNPGGVITETMLSRLDHNTAPRAASSIAIAWRRRQAARCSLARDGQAVMAGREGSDRGSDRAVRRQHPARRGAPRNQPLDDLPPQDRVGKGAPALGRVARDPFRLRHQGFRLPRA